MQKKSLLIFILGLMLINFVSAYYGSYNSFSLGNLLDSIDSSTIVLGSIFLISFALLNFSLSRVFKDQYGTPNKAMSGIIAFLVSLLMIYGINKTGFDYEGLFYGFGFSSDLLSFLAPIILLVGAIYIIWRLGFAALFLIAGLILVLLSYFTDLIYENGIATILGVTFLLIGLWLWNKNKQSAVGYNSSPASQRFYNKNIGSVKGMAEGTVSGVKKGWGKTKDAGNWGRDKWRARQEQKRAQQAQEQSKQQEIKQIEAQKEAKRLKGMQERKQIGVGMKGLVKEYNQIQRQNPGDPRLYDLTKEIKKLKAQKRK